MLIKIKIIFLLLILTYAYLNQIKRDEFNFLFQLFNYPDYVVLFKLDLTVYIFSLSKFESSFFQEITQDCTLFNLGVIYFYHVYFQTGLGFGRQKGKIIRQEKLLFSCASRPPEDRTNKLTCYNFLGLPDFILAAVISLIEYSHASSLRNLYFITAF